MYIVNEKTSRQISLLFQCQQTIMNFIRLIAGQIEDITYTYAMGNENVLFRLLNVNNNTYTYVYGHLNIIT